MTNDYLVHKDNKFYILSINSDLDVESEISEKLGSGCDYLPLEDNHNITTSITITTQ